MLFEVASFNRTTIEGILVKHFVSELNTDELFERYIHKMKNSQRPFGLQTLRRWQICLFLLGAMLCIPSHEVRIFGLVQFYLKYVLILIW